VHRTWHKLAGAALARCSTAMSSRSPTAWTICGNCAHCRTRQRVSSVSCRCRISGQQRYPGGKTADWFRPLRTIAVSRVYLDNFDHITVLGGHGLKLAQVALSFGADDLHGTIIEEHIFRMAGANPPQLRSASTRRSRCCSTSNPK